MCVWLVSGIFSCPLGSPRSLNKLIFSLRSTYIPILSSYCDGRSSCSGAGLLHFFFASFCGRYQK